MHKDSEVIAKRMTEVMANESFRFFNSREFRKFSQYEKLELGEQDRIFNEIIANAIVLGVLMFKTAGEVDVNRDKEQFYNQLSLELTNRYGNWLLELGSQKEHAEMFKKLIKMRSDEYQEDYKENKKHLGDMRETNVWIPIVSTSGFSHITRGDAKADRDKNYFLLFRDFIGNLSVEIIEQIF
jgi:hypothetical protein